MSWPTSTPTRRRYHSAALKQFLRFADDQPIYDALEMGRVSPALATHLEGLLTPEEINEVVVTVATT